MIDKNESKSCSLEQILLLNKDSSLSLDEKLQMAMKNQISKPHDEDVEAQEKVGKTEQNVTGTTLNTLNNEEKILPVENVMNPNAEKFNCIVKGRKIFKIKKYVKYNKFLSEICSSEEHSDTEQNKMGHPSAKKISPFSKVNFSKLKAEEKDERLKNLAKLVKRLRRKVRNLENKVRFNATKLLNKHIWNKLGINSKNKYLQPEFQFDFDKICKALRKVRNNEEFEFDDQKHLIENIINLVSEEKLKLNSLTYKRICSLLRPLIPKEKVKSLLKRDPKITISFPETEVYISSKEFATFSEFAKNREAMRAILNVYENENQEPEKNITKPFNNLIKIPIQALTEEKSTPNPQSNNFMFNINSNNMSKSGKQINNNQNFIQNKSIISDSHLNNLLKNDQMGLGNFSNNILSSNTTNNLTNNFSNNPLSNNLTNNILSSNMTNNFSNNLSNNFTLNPQLQYQMNNINPNLNYNNLMLMNMQKNNNINNNINQIFNQPMIQQMNQPMNINQMNMNNSYNNLPNIDPSLLMFNGGNLQFLLSSLNSYSNEPFYYQKGNERQFNNIAVNNDSANFPKNYKNTQNGDSSANNVFIK